MKKIIVFMCALLLALTAAGCGNEWRGYPLTYDDQLPADGEFNESLFYRNDLDTACADPQVMYISDPDSTEYGYYYLYATSDATMSVTGFTAWRSKDLTSWENVSQTMGFPAFYPTDDHYGFSNFWAPECIYDPDTDKYYFYYSCSNRFITDTDWTVMIGCAVADEPYGPFLALEDETHNASTPFFDNDRMMEAVANAGGEVTTYFTCIDPHPYVAPDGTKYLYFVRDRNESVQQTHIWGMRMNSWTEPDYATLTRLTRTNYVTVDGDERMPTDMESTNNGINEGPFIYETLQEDGSYRYYLTLSVNGYTDKSYTVLQAVGDSPLGPFTKLMKEYGGILIGTDGQSWDHISGPGHHSFVRAGDELFIVYHEHINRVMGNSQRAVAIDRVEVTTNSKGEEVLYANGPTWSLQPRPEAFSEYGNIADEATVSADGSLTNAEALTDGLLSLYSYIDYVKEAEVRGETTIKITFPDYREITGLMIYNSKNFNNSFYLINRIEFDFRDEATNITDTAYIENLGFDWEFYKSSGGQFMRPGGSSVAIFNPMMVKEIRITIDTETSRYYIDENGQESDLLCIRDDEGYITSPEWIGLSEIAVLGK